MKNNLQTIEVVTFATTSNNLFFKDFSDKLSLLIKNCEELNLKLTIFGLDELRDLISKSPFKFNLMFRRGVGAWFWKPIILKKAIKESRSDFILYLDVDCFLLKDPLEIISNSLGNKSFGGFKQNEKLGNWTSKRAIKLLKIGVILADASLWTAGILVFKKNAESMKFLSIWERGMLNPKVLFEPIRDFRNTRHRHDQVILSYLIANGSIECVDLGSGFYSNGVEGTSSDLSKSWVATGNLDKSVPFIELNLIQKLTLRLNYSLSIIQFFLYYFFVWPIHRISYFVYLNRSLKK